MILRSPDLPCAPAISGMICGRAGVGTLGVATPHRRLCECLVERDLPGAGGDWLRSSVKLRGERGGPRWSAGSGWSRSGWWRWPRRAPLAPALGRVRGVRRQPGRRPAGSAGRVCTSSACISLSGLARSIDAQLRGNVVGYVALVGQSQVVSSGLARTAADPPKLAMGPDVMVNVASVGKMFTTIAVLKSLARHHLSIDSRIWPFLPPNWSRARASTPSPSANC